jgi:type I restriction enzyme, R subunit
VGGCEEQTHHRAGWISQNLFCQTSLLNILTRYCVFRCGPQAFGDAALSDRGAEQILQRIAISTNHRQLGTVAAGGYIWHTTGSGKTLTSFKTAQLASKLPEIDKVLFVVDRKDLDYQTMREYERFEKGAANSNTSTRAAERSWKTPTPASSSPPFRSSDRFVANNKKHPVYDGPCCGDLR